MRIARILDDRQQVCYAIADEGGLLHRAEGVPWSSAFRRTGHVVEARQWLAPLEPRALLCIGRNFAAHAAEQDAPPPEYPVVFFKNPAAATGHLQPIQLPRVCSDEVDYEGELAVVIGRDCCNVPEEDALGYVLGYTIANDVSARVWQFDRGGSQWSRAKSFDTFAPLGPWIVTPDEVGDPGALTIRTELNDTPVQDDATSSMLFSVPALIAFLSQDTTLLAGTVILTGTPSGIGWARKPRRMLRPGDTVSVTISGLGTLTNPVIVA